MKKIISILLICAMGITLMSAMPAAAAANTGSSNGILASFHVIYDVHVPRDTASYEAALKNMQNINPDTSIALVIGGDNTVNTEISELDTFYGVLARNNPVSDEETIVILGNHDVRGANVNGNWNGEPDPDSSFPFWETAKERYRQYNKDYMPDYAQKTLYHAKELGGYTFIALNTELGMKDQMYMSDTYLEWLDATMKEAYEKNPTKPIFIISHQPMYNTIWRTDNRGLDFAGSVVSTGLDAKVQAILEKYPTSIFISGHQHNELDTIETVIRPWASYIDVPAHYADAERGRDGGLGYEVEIYNDKVVFRAVNFKTNAWYPNEDLVVPIANGGVSAVYQTAKKQMQDVPEIYDETDRWLLNTLEGMLTQTYTQSRPREEQFYYTTEDINDIVFVAEQLKSRVGPFPGDTLSLDADKLELTPNGTAKLLAAVGDNAVAGKHLIWTSSDSSVVEVVGGKLTAVSAGEAVITVSSIYDSTLNAVCAVKVTSADVSDGVTTDTVATDTDNTDSSQSKSTEEKGGCGSFVATNIVAIVGLTAGAGVFFCRKKTRD